MNANSPFTVDNIELASAIMDYIKSCDFSRALVISAPTKTGKTAIVSKVIKELGLSDIYPQRGYCTTDNRNIAHALPQSFIINHVGDKNSAHIFQYYSDDEVNDFHEVILNHRTDIPTIIEVAHTNKQKLDFNNLPNSCKNKSIWINYVLSLDNWIAYVDDGEKHQLAIEFLKQHPQYFIYRFFYNVLTPEKWEDFDEKVKYELRNCAFSKKMELSENDIPAYLCSQMYVYIGGDEMLEADMFSFFNEKHIIVKLYDYYQHELELEKLIEEDSVKKTEDATSQKETEEPENEESQDDDEEKVNWDEEWNYDDESQENSGNTNK